MSLKLFIIIPAYNEEQTIGSVVRAVCHHCSAAQILVIDDGSQDKTRERAKRHGALVLSHARNRGLGAALGTGLRAARRLDADIVVTMDADGQHDARDIDRLTHPIIQNRIDIVIGTRMHNAQGMPYVRRAINIGSNILTWMLFGCWTSDSQSGFRAFSRKALSKLVLRSDRMEVSSEIFREVARHRLRMAEVPIRTIYSDYSLQKGQPLSNSVNVAWKLFLRAVR